MPTTLPEGGEMKREVRAASKASRDLTYKQFFAALKRNRFGGPTLLWCHDLDNPNHSYGVIVDRKGKLYKRQTIAYLLERRRAVTKERLSKAEGAQ